MLRQLVRESPMGQRQTHSARALRWCLVFAVAGFSSGPAWSEDNGGGGASVDDIAAACHATFMACMDACGAMGGTKFSDEFARQGCEIGCEQADEACYKSVSSRKDAARTKKHDRPKAVAQ